MKVGRSAGATDPGRRRRRNEDSYVVEPPVFAVADGMGGARAGEIASRLAAGAVRGGGEDVEALIQEANRRVHERAQEDETASGMGTTLTVAWLELGIVRIGHVGDSRAYLVRDGSLEQLTQDHSLVAELVRSGKLSPEEAESHPQRSVITRALGTDPDVDVDTLAIESQPGDLFLICSDGLTSMVDDERILELVQEQRGDLEALCLALIKAANKGGGEDNITVVAFEIAADGDADLEETQTIGTPETGAGDADDEDTLTEADRVPAVDTMVVKPEEIAAAYEQPAQPRRKRRLLSRLAALVLIVALICALVLVSVWGLTR